MVAVTDFYNVEITDANGCTAQALEDVYVMIVSTDPAPQQWSISVYPNPATNWIAVRLEEGIISKVRLLTLQGRTVFEKIVKHDVASITIDQLPEGIYLLHIEMEGVSEVHRMVKARN